MAPATVPATVMESPTLAAFNKQLRDSRHMNVLVLVMGARDESTGLSWCSDCEEAEPVMHEAFGSAKVAVHTKVVEVRVTKDEWRDKHPHFARTEPSLLVTALPTALLLTPASTAAPAAAHRLVESECVEAAKVKSLLKMAKRAAAASRQATLMRLFYYARPDALRMAGGLLALVVSSANNMNTPRTLGWIIDTAVKGRQHTSRVLSQSLLLFAFGAAASWTRVFLLHSSRESIVHRLRKSAYESALSQDNDFLDSTHTSDLIRTIDDDVVTAGNAITTDIARGLRSLSSTIGGSIMIFRISPQLTGLSLMSLPLIGASSMLFSKFAKRQRKIYDDLVRAAHERQVEVLNNVVQVRLSSQEPEEVERHSTALDAILGSSSRAAAAEGLLMAGLSFAGSASLAMVLMRGGSLVRAGQMSSGKLTSFGMYSGLLGLGCAGLSSFFTDLAKSLCSARRLIQLIDRTPATHIHEGIVPDSVKGHLQFKSVKFEYAARPGVTVLDDLSVDIPAGSRVALVGVSGAGKSSVAALLARLYEPAAGHITLDGQPLDSLQPLWLRRNVCVVQQRPAMFAGTVADNIRYGAPDATDEQVRQAARMANALEFIEAFPEQFETKVGQGGTLLSGGQMQRVAIARAVLLDSPVLVLDEATSSLDGESERAVVEALERVGNGRTMLIIAHRPSLVRAADRVVVMEGGKVVETGTYAELMGVAGGRLPSLMSKAGPSEQ